MMTLRFRSARSGIRAAVCLAFLAVGGCASLASAPPLQFTDRTYFAPKTYRDSTISYDAFVAPPIFIYDDEPDKIRSLLGFNGSASRIGWRSFVTPAFIIRQLNDSSSAVRTPSFNPRVSGELYRVSALDRVVKAGRPEFDWVRIDAFRLTIAHHSDGQAGCFLQEQTPAKAGSFEADDCSAPPATGFLHTNRANGDFSTTFASFLLHETLVRNTEGQRTPIRAGIAFGYDWELPKGSAPGALPDIERQFYGSWRSRVQADVMIADQLQCADNRWLCFLHGQTRVTAMYEWAPRNLGPLASRLEQPIPHFRSYFDVSHTFDALHGFGLLVRRVDGQDYYNIGFVHRRPATLLGIVLDLGGNEFAR
jgi:hypothetical protein